MMKVRRQRIIRIVFILIVIVILLSIIHIKRKDNSIEVLENLKEGKNYTSKSTKEDFVSETKVASDGENEQEIRLEDFEKQMGNVKLDWRLTLVNPNNKLPEDYNISFESIDEYRKFDSRAIKYLIEMLNDMKYNGITNIWVQSSYRSVEYQQRIYTNQIEQYKKQGKTEEQAIILTEKIINKPGYSEHNLGLAVDFNYVDEEFEDTKAFKWLKENAESYGFILRYPKEKEGITKIKYEPWHWRYVGEENAKNMNKFNMCLEEYVELIKN